MAVAPDPPRNPDVGGTTTVKRRHDLRDDRSSPYCRLLSSAGTRSAQDSSYIGMISSRSAMMAAAASTSAAASHAMPRRAASSSEESTPAECSAYFNRPSAISCAPSASPPQMPATPTSRASLIIRRVGDRISLARSSAMLSRQGTAPNSPAERVSEAHVGFGARCRHLEKLNAVTISVITDTPHKQREKLEKRSSRSSLGTPPTSGRISSAGSESCAVGSSSASAAASGPPPPSPHQLQQPRTSRPSRLVTVSFREDPSLPAGRTPQGLDPFHRPERASAVRRRSSVPFGIARLQLQQGPGRVGEEVGGGMKRSASHSAALCKLQHIDASMPFL